MGKISLNSIAHNTEAKRQIFLLLRNPRKTSKDFLQKLCEPHLINLFGVSSDSETKVDRNYLYDGNNHRAIYIEYKSVSRGDSYYCRFFILDDLNLRVTYQVSKIGVSGMIEFYNSIINHYNSKQ